MTGTPTRWRLPRPPAADPAGPADRGPAGTAPTGAGPATGLARWAGARVVDLHRPLLGFAALAGVVAVVAVVGLGVDDRTLLGAPVWLKPLKFALSLGLYATTLAVLLARRGPTGRAGRVARRAGTLVAVTGAVELVVIAGQAARGRASHFDVATTTDTVLWAVMGASIVALWWATLVVGVLVARRPGPDPAATSALRAGIALALVGMALGFLMTSPTAQQLATMRAGGSTGLVGGHTVGAADGGPGLPLLGWSSAHGDLRVPHFVGLHALQTLPLVGLGLALLGRRLRVLADPLARRRIVRVAAVGTGGLLALLTAQALRGQALLRPDAVTLAAAAVLVVGGLIALAVAARLAACPAVRPAACPAVRPGVWPGREGSLPVVGNLDPVESTVGTPRPAVRGGAQ